MKKIVNLTGKKKLKILKKNHFKSLNLIYRLIGQKRKPDQSICFLDSILGDRNSINKFELDESLFVMSKALVYFVFTFFKSRAHQKVLFETSFFEHELIQILYMNSLMKQTDRIQLTNR